MAPRWLTAKTLSPITSVADRSFPTRLCATVYATVPLPAPLAADVTVSQSASLTAVQLQSAEAVTASVPVPPGEKNSRLAAEIPAHRTSIAMGRRPPSAYCSSRRSRRPRPRRPRRRRDGRSRPARRARGAPRDNGPSHRETAAAPRRARRSTGRRGGSRDRSRGRSRAATAETPGAHIGHGDRDVDGPARHALGGRGQECDDQVRLPGPRVLDGVGANDDLASAGRAPPQMRSALRRSTTPRRRSRLIIVESNRNRPRPITLSATGCEPAKIRHVAAHEPGHECHPARAN